MKTALRLIGYAVLAGLCALALLPRPVLAQLNRVAPFQIITPSGIATTSTDGLNIINNTASTAGVPVQQSARLRFRSNVWNTTPTAANNTDDFFIESVPASGTTPSGLLKFGSSLNGAAATYPMTLTSGGALANAGSIVSQGSISSVSTVNTNTYFSGGAVGNQIALNVANGLMNVAGNTLITTLGPQFNMGSAAPTVTSCSTGAVTAHSNNTFGEVTPTGATVCTLTFGAPNWSNQPFCVITVEATTVTAYVSAISVSAFTVSGLASGEKFMYHCGGGI